MDLSEKSNPETPQAGVPGISTAQDMAGSLDHTGPMGRGLRRMERPAEIPLSFAQRRLWLLSRIEEPSAAYNIPLSLRFRGNLDQRALEAALLDVIERQESLRTVFPHDLGNPRQAILDTTECGFHLLIASSEERSLKRDLETAAKKSFDPTREIPLRAGLFQLNPDEHVLLLVMHRIAADARSAEPLMHDLSEAYAARCAGSRPGWEELPLQYADYALWQRELLESGDDEDRRQLTYWRGMLDGLPEQLNLPADRVRPPIASYRGAKVRYEVNAEIHQRLAKVAKEANASPFIVLQAGVVALLTRLGAGTDIPIGREITAPPHREIEKLVGSFSNTLVLRTDASGNPKINELIARVRTVNLNADANQDVQFQRLVEVLNPPRSLARRPLFQVMMRCEDVSLTESKFIDLITEPVQVETGTTQFDLIFSANDSKVEVSSRSLCGHVEYACDLFDQTTGEAIARRLELMLSAFAFNQELRIGEIDLLRPEERWQILEGWNATSHDVADVTLVDLLERQAAEHPARAAVVFVESTLTYDELNNRANRLAHRLIGLGVGPECMVGICLDRSLEMIVAVLAVLKAGGAYVPLSAENPEARLSYLIADAAPAAVVTNENLSRRFARDVVTIKLDSPETKKSLDRFPAHNPSDEERTSPLFSSNPAYATYTSGSTGEPKGVVIEHRSVVVFAVWAGSVFTDDEWSGVLASTPLGFDLSVFELLATLIQGGTIILAQSALELPILPAKDRVRLMNTVPSLVRSLLDSFGLPPTVRTVNLGGEASWNSVVQDLYKLEHLERVLDLYGPSEATVYATFSLCRPHTDQEPTIGSPIWNTRAYVLDQNMEPVAKGVTGDLYLGGQGLARGYLRRAGLTADRFVGNPYGSPGSRLYRTGDMARWNSNGEVEYLGRADHQVKFRGFRVELGEIEAALLQEAGVAHAAATMRDETEGDRTLIGYVVANDGVEVVAEEIKRELRKRLPGYMVPGVIVVMNNMPLTPNGKVDRSRLPAPDSERREWRAPQSEAEKTVSRLFKEVLQVERAGLDDSFFLLGGDSIALMRFVSRAQEAGLQIVPRDIFQFPTVEALARLADSIT